MPAWLIHPALEAVGTAAAIVVAWRMLRRPGARLTALTLGLAAYSLGDPLRLIGVEPFLWAALVSILGYAGLLALAGLLLGRARPTFGPEALIALMPLLLYPFALFAAALLAHARTAAP
jgi:hypothetical protein